MFTITAGYEYRGKGISRELERQDSEPLIKGMWAGIISRVQRHISVEDIPDSATSIRLILRDESTGEVILDSGRGDTVESAFLSPDRNGTSYAGRQRGDKPPHSSVTLGSRRLDLGEG